MISMKMLIEESDAPPWQVLSPAYAWKEHNLLVLADRHLLDGTRQHLVAGSVPPGLQLSNAQIFGYDDLVAAGVRLSGLQLPAG